MIFVKVVTSHHTNSSLYVAGSLWLPVNFSVHAESHTVYI